MKLTEGKIRKEGRPKTERVKAERAAAAPAPKAQAAPAYQPPPGPEPAAAVASSGAYPGPVPPAPQPAPVPTFDASRGLTTTTSWPPMPSTGPSPGMAPNDERMTPTNFKVPVPLTPNVAEDMAQEAYEARQETEEVRAEALKALLIQRQEAAQELEAIRQRATEALQQEAQEKQQLREQLLAMQQALLSQPLASEMPPETAASSGQAELTNVADTKGYKSGKGCGNATRHDGWEARRS